MTWVRVLVRISIRQGENNGTEAEVGIRILGQEEQIHLGHEKIQWRQMSKLQGEKIGDNFLLELVQAVWLWKVQKTLMGQNMGRQHQNGKLMVSESVTPWKSGVTRSHWSNE